MQGEKRRLPYVTTHCEDGSARHYSVTDTAFQDHLVFLKEVKKEDIITPFKQNIDHETLLEQRTKNNTRRRYS
jgi:hypothetical protein